MEGELLHPVLGFGAGALTILSPCVLPLVPVVLGSAAQRHRLGPLALGVGLIASFTSVGFVLAVFGSRLGVDAAQVRASGAVILGLAGALLLMPGAQVMIARSASPLIAWAGERQQRFDDRGLWGQAAIGALLGLVWSPCVGPTLGAAIAVAAQGKELSLVALTMGAFACGIAAVLLILAVLGRTMLMKLRGRISARADAAKVALGIILVTVALLILTGLDRKIEAGFLDRAPDWLVQLATSL
jgi:cytochrome c-type biogenesis protein